MSTLREAAQQALAFTMRDFATMRDFRAARAVVQDTLRAALAQQDPEFLVTNCTLWGPPPKPHEYWSEFFSAMVETRTLAGVFISDAALAQPAEPTQTPCDIAEDGVCEAIDCCQNPQQAAPVDQTVMELAESVGLIGPASRTHDLHGAIQRFHDLIVMNASIKAAAAFAAPPQRKPLTDEEIYEMYSEPSSDAEMVEFARAIERAHGIGGDDGQA